MAAVHPGRPGPDDDDLFDTVGLFTHGGEGSPRDGWRNATAAQGRVRRSVGYCVARPAAKHRAQASNRPSRATAISTGRAHGIDAQAVGTFVVGDVQRQEILHRRPGSIKQRPQGRALSIQGHLGASQSRLDGADLLPHQPAQRALLFPAQRAGESLQRLVRIVRVGKGCGQDRDTGQVPVAEVLLGAPAQPLADRQVIGVDPVLADPLHHLGHIGAKPPPVEHRRKPVVEVVQPGTQRLLDEMAKRGTHEADRRAGAMS